MGALRHLFSYSCPSIFRQLCGLLLLGILCFTPAKGWLNQIFHDWRENLWWSERGVSAVSLLLIDEDSIGHFGAWPWSRDQWAQILLRLQHVHQAQVVALDIVFPPDGNRLNNLIFARQLERMPAVLGQIATTGSQVNGVWKYDPQLTALRNQLSNNILSAAGLLANDPLLTESALVGHINALVDSDGLVRQYAPVMCVQEHCSQALALAAVAHAAGSSGWSLGSFAASKSTYLYLNDLDHLQLPLNDAGSIVIPWSQFSRVPVISLVDALQASSAHPWLHNRIVFIGVNAPGLADTVVTPVHARMPGVMAHALVAASIVENTLPKPLPLHDWVVFGIYALFALILAACESRSHHTTLIVMPSVSLVVIGVWVLAYHRYRWDIALGPAIVSACVLAVLQWSQLFIRQQRSVLQRMASYLPETLTQRLRYGKALSPTHEWCVLLYLDTVGYTSASQGLTAEQLAQWVNAGLDIVINLIKKHGGVVDNIAGDGLMAYWVASHQSGASAHLANAALQVCTTACDALRSASAELQKQGFPPLQMGFGLHAGKILAGSFGTEALPRFTIHGEAANIAHRIELVTRQGPHQILMSEDLAHLQTQYQVLEVFPALTIGTRQPIRLFTLVPDASEAP